MTLTVHSSDQAWADVRECCRWWAEHRSAEQAERWYDCCSAAIKSLSQKAKRCRKAPESNDFPFEVRQITFGVGRRPTHRAVFTIRPDMIYVLRVQHLAKDKLTIDDI